MRGCYSHKITFESDVKLHLSLILSYIIIFVLLQLNNLSLHAATDEHIEHFYRMRLII